MEADQLGRLQDMPEATRLIATYVQATTAAAFRAEMAHDYANVDVGIVWEVATVHVPEVCAVLERFFADKGHTPPSAIP